MNGFHPKPPDKGTTPFHRYCALKLHEATKRQVNMILDTSSMKHSAKQFSLLEKECKEDTDRIDNVLDWYCKNIGSEYTPKARSGKMFRSKFAAIEEAMKRDRRRSPNVEVTQEAKDIVKKLKQLRWPKGSEKQLPAMVQLSLNNYRSFYAHLRKDTRSASSYLHLRLPAPVPYVTDFYVQLHAQISTWDQWSGKLAAVEINDRFKRYCIDILSHYSRNAGITADKLMEGYHESREQE